MIQLNRNYTLPERDDDLIPIKIIGLGGAGSNVLDRMVLEGVEKGDLIAANTDVQSLASSVATHKVQLGREVTRGLGAGGDPDLGYEAAREANDELRHALADARMVFLCVGLGGGTGSGAAPVIAEMARENGAMVICFATMPFGFEGKRRNAQATAALAQLQAICSAVVCFENDKMGDIVAPKAGVHQAFAAADVTITQSVRAIAGIIQRPGLVRIGFDDLLAALRNPNARCLFGYGEAETDNRSHDALTQALKNPLMDRGRMLEEAVSVLVHVAGGPGMTLSEVEILMGELNRHVGDETQIFFGTAVDSRMGNRMAVTIISSLAAEGGVVAAPKPVRKLASKMVPPTPQLELPPEPKPEPEPEPETETEPELEPGPEPELEPIPLGNLEFEEAVEPAPLQMIEATFPEPVDEEEPVRQPTVEPAPEPPVEAAPLEPPPMLEPEPAQPRVLLPKTKPAPAPIRPPKPERTVAKQELMQFESVTRGRFEKSEPTIVEGQDLDVPTFLRKNVKVK